MTQATPQPMMSFGSAIRTGLHKYAEFEGRAAKAEFWWFILFATLVGSALGALNVATPQGVITIGSSLASVWTIAIILPTLAAAARRLRDAGHPATELWWLLVPIAGLIVLVAHLCEPSEADPAAS